ncbi:WLM domain-containing protein [Scenedesmus sp. NREL 46B-D3]|nr:WLM domain-containing protein [Scenedesmus sp. NREL 46B-D3]
MPVTQIDRYQVQEIKTLGKDREAEARQMLERVAKQVQPIMRKRQWTVRKLSEFIPRSPNLLGLNVNRGQEVKIRLRPAGREGSFYDWNHVLGTMLHELCHNRIGPHNAEFYKLLDELWSEAEELMDKGISGTGQGFDAPSVGRLGSHGFIPTHNPPEHKMADAMRKAAEARARQQALMPAGPCKLGGGPGYRHMTPAQAAAAAAERRARDELWCGAGRSAEEVEREVGSGTGAGSSRGNSSGGTSTATGNQLAGQRSDAVGTWVCPACTLVNGALVLQCEACLTVRSSR